METERHAPTSFRDLLAHMDWRQELLGVAMVAAEAFPVYLVVSLILNPTGKLEAFPFWLILFLLLSAHATARVLDAMRIWSPEYEIKMGIGIVLTLLVAIRFGAYGSVGMFDLGWFTDAIRALSFLPNDQERHVWGIVALTIYAWWRGRSRVEPSVDASFTVLRIGSTALIIGIIAVLAGAQDGAHIRDQLSIVTVGFFATALSAVGVSRLKLEGVRSSAPLGARWIGTFLVPIAAVVIAATLFAGIFSRQFLDTVLWLLTPIFWILGLVFQVLVLIVAVLAFIILTPIFWLIGERESQFEPETPQADDLESQEGLQQAVSDAFQMPDALRYLIAAIVLFVIISLLTRFVFKRRGTARPPTGEVRESVLDWNDLLGNMGDRLRGMFRREQQPDPLAHLRGDDAWRHTLRIREVYTKLQRRGDESGRARRRSETAEEYRPGVSSALGEHPDIPPAVEAITARYRKARYSGKPAGASDADIVEVNWETIDGLPKPES
jgi:hypothetical protein